MVVPVLLFVPVLPVVAFVLPVVSVPVVEDVPVVPVVPVVLLVVEAPVVALLELELVEADELNLPNCNVTTLT